MVDKSTFSFLKLDIRKNFIKKLYQFSLQKILDNIYKLVKENSLLHNKINTSEYQYNCVYYENNYFFEKQYSKHDYNEIIERHYYNELPIHNKLEQQFNFLFKELTSLIDEKDKNTIYINQILNLSNNIADVYALIPKALHKYVKYESNNFSSVTPTINDSIVQQHKEKHIKPRTFLKERLVTDLLLRNN